MTQVQWIQHDASAAITCFLVYHPGTMGPSSTSSSVATTRLPSCIFPPVHGAYEPRTVVAGMPAA